MKVQAAKARLTEQLLDDTLTGAEVLAAYRYQPNLERRNHILKGPQAVAPVYLQTPHRIEALLLCQFLALLVGALIERQIRTAMAADELTRIPLYPELRSCPTPSATRILEIFTGITRHHLTNHNGRAIQIFEPTLTPLQQQVLELLDIPTTSYQQPPNGGCSCLVVKRLLQVSWTVTGRRGWRW